ncbi:MAG: hemerythrin domain-containing protein [Acidiferrobacter sp.]
MQAILLDGFTRHHRLLDETFLEARGTVDNADWEKAASTFQVFWDAIEKHMRTEETYLFPVYEKDYGAENALTGILRKGHRDLRGFFEEISETIDAHDEDEASALMGTVAQILSHHDEKEEQEFYPAVAPLITNPQDVVNALLA